MKLELINPRSKPFNGFENKVKALTITTKNLVRFSKMAFKELKLEDGVRINFYNDNDALKSFYMSIEDDGLYEVHGRTPKERSFSSKRLRQRIEKALGYNDNEIIVLEITDPVVYKKLTVYPLIKMNLKNLRTR